MRRMTMGKCPAADLRGRLPLERDLVRLEPPGRIERKVKDKKWYFGTDQFHNVIRRIYNKPVNDTNNVF